MKHRKVQIHLRVVLNRRAKVDVEEMVSAARYFIISKVIKGVLSSVISKKGHTLQFNTLHG